MYVYYTKANHDNIQGQKQVVRLLRYVLILSHFFLGLGVGRITASRMRCSLALSEISRFR